jgi:hypothetical protein
LQTLIWRCGLLVLHIAIVGCKFGSMGERQNLRGAHYTRQFKVRIQPVTPQRLKAALKTIFGPDDFICGTMNELKVDQATVYRWLASDGKVPGPVAAWADAKMELLSWPKKRSKRNPISNTGSGDGGEKVETHGK